VTSDGTPIDAQDAFASLGRIVLGNQPLPAVLEQVLQIARRVLPVQVEASITLISADGPSTVAFTGESALALDERQYEDERGPCLECAATRTLLSAPDLASDPRWPRLAAAAQERGIRSSLSIPLPMQREVAAALNLYATEPGAFDDDTADLAQTFAAHAAVAVANAYLYETTAALAEQMKQAMTSRAVIEQAKGIIMRDRSCSADEAFDALVQISQGSHLKLREVAQRLVDQVSHGDHPGGDTSG
jgi:GAF domain-containing protein